MATPTHDRFELPDNEWADIYFGNKIPERKRRPVTRAAVAMGRTMPEQDTTTVEVTHEAEGETVAAFGGPTPDAVVEAPVAEERHVKLADLPDEGIDAIDDFNDAVIIAFVLAWSFEGPVAEETLLELPGDAYDALVKECQRRNKGGAGSVAEPPDATDPTSPSGASSTLSSTETETAPTSSGLPG